ncbi:MAG: DUF421 domain-containing protein [Actinomycetota bacterium]|nr:DUF421 domain-containing protein [Actinomycetota bacterium]
MSEWLVGPVRTPGFVALSTALVYASTVVALRLGERRTIAEMSTFDFIVAVALEAVVGRTATTRQPTYLQGMTAIVALVLAHHLVGLLRRRSAAARRLIQRPPTVLVSGGQIDDQALAGVDLTSDDLAAKLRERGVARLEEVDLAVLESDGRVSVITRGAEPVGELLWRGLGERQPPAPSDPPRQRRDDGAPG